MAPVIVLLILFCGIDSLLLSLAACTVIVIALSLGIPALAVILAAPFVLAAMAWTSWKLTAPLWASLVGDEDSPAAQPTPTSSENRASEQSDHLVCFRG